MTDEKIYLAKVWYSSNGKPLIRLGDELLENMPIELERTLFVKRKTNSIEIFNSNNVTTKE